MADRKFLATIRAVFEAEDEVEAALIANEIQEATSALFEEDVTDGTVDVTQVIPYGLVGKVEPAELVAQLRRCCDMLIMTRIVQCFEQAKELDKLAWILEHREEETFDITGYDYGAIFERADKLLGRKKS